MTRQEFDAWIEVHHSELLAVARRRVRRDADDVVQQAVTGMLSSVALATTPPRLAWPWAVGFVRGAASHARRSVGRRRALAREAKNAARAGSIHGRKRPAPRAD